MFILLKTSKTEANKGIYHTRENGDFVQELFRKDAELIYEVTEQCNFLGETYAFFIIDVANGDILQYGEYKHYPYEIPRFDESNIYWDSCKVAEMCYQLVEQNKELPSKLDNLLKDYLSLFFQEIIKRSREGFDSSSIWDNYQDILLKLNKNVNDYVSQDVIDNFLYKLIEEKELRQVMKITQSKCINFSEQNKQAYIEAEKVVNEAILIAKQLVSEKGYSDITHNVSGDPICDISAKDTPCGNIGIHIKLDYGEFKALLAIQDAKIGGITTIDITEKCKEYAKNFKSTCYITTN